MEKQRKSRGFVSALAMVGVAFFVFSLGYTTVEGPFGLLNLYKVQKHEVRLQLELDTLTMQRQIAENRAHRLSDEYLDLDLLDEQARKVLGLIRGDERIIH